MNVMQGSLIILDLGTPNVKYMWKGTELHGVVKVFVYKGTSLTVTVADKGASLTVTVVDKEAVPVDEMKAYGIKVKEVR